MRTSFTRFAQRGATGQQYAILVGLIAVVAILAITAAGSSVNLLMSRVSNTLGGVGNVTSGGSGGGGGGGGGFTPPPPLASGLYSWGQNGNSQIQPGTSNVSTPTAYTGIITSATQIITGFDSSCALVSGTVYCWGADGYGQLGNGAAGATATPSNLNNGGAYTGGNMTEIDGGGYHHCGRVGSTLVCWGQGGNGKLGNSGTSDSTTIVNVSSGGGYNGSNANGIRVGEYGACGLLSTGAAVCWGQNNFGAFGTGSTGASNPTPVAIGTGGGYTGTNLNDIGGPGPFNCFLTTGGAVGCSGYNNYGQIGNNSTTDTTSWIAVNSNDGYTGSNATQLSVGSGHACIILGGGKILCWGTGSWGRTGTSSNGAIGAPNVLVPTAVVANESYSGSNAVQVEAYQAHACARLSGANMVCWGWNFHGQVGAGTPAFDPGVPLPTALAITPNLISRGHGHFTWARQP